jgi:hypothetical protein
LNYFIFKEGDTFSKKILRQFMAFQDSSCLKINLSQGGLPVESSPFDEGISIIAYQSLGECGGVMRIGMNHPVGIDWCILP